MGLARGVPNGNVSGTPRQFVSLAFHAFLRVMIVIMRLESGFSHAFLRDKDRGKSLSDTDCVRQACCRKNRLELFVLLRHSSSSCLSLSFNREARKDLLFERDCSGIFGHVHLQKDQWEKNPSCFVLPLIGSVILNGHPSKIKTGSKKGREDNLISPLRDPAFFDGECAELDVSALASKSSILSSMITE